MRAPYFTSSAKQIRDALVFLHSHGPAYKELPPTVRLKLVECAALLRTNAYDNAGLILDAHSFLHAVVRESWLVIDLRSHYAAPSRGAASMLAFNKISPVVDALYLQGSPGGLRPLLGGYER